MCGIAGVVDWSGKAPPRLSELARMLAIIHHRGPDENGVYLDATIGLASARLSIVDLSTGQQPITNEDGSLWIVFNGEVFNYPELRRELEARGGHEFYTQSDTEVILHLYEELGPACLHRLNGQFAIAIWDARKKQLFLARDRLGIRPLFYTLGPDEMVFASEIKALYGAGRLPARLDVRALAQSFTFWAPLAPRTAFEGVMELPPGHFLEIGPDGSRVSRYWSLTFPAAGNELDISLDDAAAELRELLSDASRLRLRADVPVAAYLSGGLDSTLIAALVHDQVAESLSTFSITFEERAFDESAHQRAAVEFLGTRHHHTECRNIDVGRVFPSVVWHAEAPLLRTSPAPMYLLSKLVNSHGIKVVLTGEGADEFLGGYNIFREDKVRRFWAREPGSAIRPLLLQRLYPYVPDLSRSGGAYLKAFFGRGLTDTDRLGYSHLTRWHNTTGLWSLFSPDLVSSLQGYNPVEDFVSQLDRAMLGWSSLSQSQYLEVATFMSPYLLSSQGDRMMAANSVEGRFPFLDHRVVDFCGRLPPRYRILGLREKHLLKRAARDLVPTQIWQRAKQPYRAPIRPAFFGQRLDYLDELLSTRALEEAGIFDPGAVGRLLRKGESGAQLSERDSMGIVGVISTQLLHHSFVNRGTVVAEIARLPDHFTVSGEPA
jgi:asparagine synthase (glutamine-hydrolysing)